MASRKQGFAKNEIPAGNFGRGFRCAEEALQKAFWATLAAFEMLFMRLASLRMKAIDNN
jgi:hypothetical protein